MTSVAALSSTLHANMKIDKLFIKNMSNCGCGDKFDLFIFSDDFEGLKTLARHQKVQTILKNEIEKLHAITFKTLLPKDYEAKKDLITDEYENCSVKADEKSEAKAE